MIKTDDEKQKEDQQENAGQWLLSIRWKGKFPWKDLIKLLGLILAILAAINAIMRAAGG